MRIDRAMVLAAGLGTRMRPLTDAMPKALVQVAGKTLLDHMLDRLSDAGVREAVVNVHHHGDQIIRHTATRSAPRVTISDESAALLDTGGGTVKALSHFQGAPFFYANTDTVMTGGSGDPLRGLAEAFDPMRMDGLLLLAPVTRAPGYSGSGDFHLDPAGRLTRKTQGAGAPFVWTTVQIVHPRLFADAPQGKFSTNLVWDWAIARGRLYGMVFDGDWLEVNTLGQRDTAESFLMQGR